MNTHLKLFTFLTLSLAASLDAQTIYIATGANGADGQLFTVNSSNAAATLVGNITVGGSPLAMTGLAFQPGSGILYGITASRGSIDNNALVTIDPASGNATLIGALGQKAGDIAFDPTGSTLYAWLTSGSGTSNTLATINVSTGAATPIGSNVTGATAGGGLAVDPSTGTIYVNWNGPSGTLDTVNPINSAVTTGPGLTGAIYSSSMNSMSFSPSSILYAVNSDNDSPANTTLVTINPSTGVVTNIGVLPFNTDGIALQSIPEPSFTAALMGLAALAGALCFRRRKLA